MKEIFVTRAYEHEFGVRFEGFIFSDRLDCLKKKIQSIEDGGTHECYWRCDKIETYYVDEQTYERIQEKTKGDGEYIWDDYLEDWDLYKIERLNSPKRRCVSADGIKL